MKIKYYNESLEKCNKSDFIESLSSLINDLNEIKEHIKNNEFHFAKKVFENEIAVDFIFKTLGE